MKKLFFTLIFFPIFQFHSQEVVITAVKVIENKIHIEYSLTGADSYELMLWYKKKYDNKWIGPLKQLQGDFGKNTRKGEKKIIWNTLNEVDDFIGEYQFGISFIEKAVIPEPIAEEEIETPTENITPPQTNYSYPSRNSNFFENISDGFSDLYITPYIAWPYVVNAFYSYPAQTYLYLPICATLGSSFVAEVWDWEYGADLTFVIGASNNVSWMNADSSNQYSAKHKYYQTRLLARANYHYGSNHYFGFGLGVKLIKEVSKSNVPEYNNTLRTFRPAARLVIGGRYDSGFTWEIGFGGGGFMIGYTFNY
jgi:hypothetical protein